MGMKTQGHSWDMWIKDTLVERHKDTIRTWVKDTWVERHKDIGRG